MRARQWAEGAGAALLLMLPYFFPVVAPGHLALYHHELPLRNVIFGVLLDITALTVIFAIVLALIMRLPGRMRLFAGAVLAAGVLWRAGMAILLVMSQSSLDPHDPGGSRQLVHIAVTGMRLDRMVATGMAMLFLLLVMAAPGAARAVIRMTRIGVAGLAFSTIWLVPQLLYLATRPGSPAAGAEQARKLPVAASHQARLIWILFDELSYHLVFEQPPAGQRFPNFEALHDHSFSFDKVEPVGNYTDRIIPALFAGTQMDMIRGTASGELEYLGSSQQHWKTFDAESSLFGLGERNGWNPGVAGWYNPYCRILATTLYECFCPAPVTLPLDAFGASESKSVTANALVVPEHLLTWLLRRLKEGNQEQREHIQDYRELMESARGLIQNEQIHFVFLHLPVPHPPGIYDRHSHRLRAGGNYLDNLTLADDTLGELMQEIGATADGDHTTVIVSSDHSWRVPMWDSSPQWTKEEEEISQETFDTRPVFLIHFPGEANGVEIRSAVPELEEHDIIAGILNRQIGSGAQMAALLRTDKIRVAGNEEERSEAGQ